MADIQGNTGTFTGTLTCATLVTTSSSTSPVATLLYGTTVSIDSSQATNYFLTVTNGVGFTVAAPTNAATGKLIRLVIKNTSGGAVGTITWNAVFKMGTFTTPATANNRTIEFLYDGTNWVELVKSAADVPN